MREQIEVRRFYPEQVTGLKEIGWIFQMEILPLSVNQLLEEPETRQLFGTVHPSGQVREVVPVARQVAVQAIFHNGIFIPEEAFIPGAANLSFYDQRQRAEEYVHNLRHRNLRYGTLDGIDFGMDRVSVVAQLDREHKRRFNRKLIVGGFTSTIDEAYDERYGLLGHAQVGRVWELNDLTILAGNAPNPTVNVFLVATPAGDR